MEKEARRPEVTCPNKSEAELGLVPHLSFSWPRSLCYSGFETGLEEARGTVLTCMGPTGVSSSTLSEGSGKGGRAQTAQ